MNIEQPNIYLVISSSLFIIPSILAAYHKLWLEYSACILITLISSLHHSIRSIYTYILDQFACYYLGAVFYIICKKLNILYIWFFGIGYSITVYNIGKLFNIMAWDTNFYISTVWHISMHLVILFTIIFVIIVSSNADIKYSVLNIW